MYIFTTSSSEVKLRRHALDNHTLQKQRFDTTPMHAPGRLSVALKLNRKIFNGNSKWVLSKT